ncbi:5'/3'-nucleotidase SurE [Amphritea sp. 2_MG-2023]|jgi:5'-nucleotidase|uniref:5'/3'-nucleotidase SurE n=1 Tax=Amphritea TaxID=515417 RepID=UPI001C0756AC|nr:MULTISPECIES: 5'/3'-nucleotidase SurE [Amphritea]MBU2964881.1 5'/3'-nucleotidase SurE [Amphritea atlantica]MDO6419956.1 5'/3'-nucleotidase SurE [Amphritea sp. 2_MG-2023]MDX2421870.1 5'/3'-nucleotidase SurE [Amphritea sp.]
MRLLLSNDDGVYAPGLESLGRILAQDAEIVVVAPDRNRSGASNSLTLDRPLESHRHQNGFVGINGTPTDCVHLGMGGIFSDAPDMVISGINCGCNLGDDVIYSGTVAAAMEGRHLHLPPIAVSLEGSNPKHYDTAAEVVRKLIKDIRGLVLAPRTVLNVNVPDLPLDQLKGIHVTRLGHRVMADAPVESFDPRGKQRFWIAGAGAAADCGPGTDFFAVKSGYVSITPLNIDMTQYSGMDNLSNWLEDAE